MLFKSAKILMMPNDYRTVSSSHILNRIFQVQSEVLFVKNCWILMME